MPMYDYLCPSCGPTSALRPMSVRTEPVICPICSGEAPRVFITAPHIGGLSSTRHVVQARNEKAGHEPIRTNLQERHEAARKHPAGCSCCSNNRSRTATMKDGSKAFPSQRPWMISH